MGVGPHHTIDEVAEGNEAMEKRERQEGITTGQAKGQTQRWQPLQPNLARVNEAAIDRPRVLSEEPTAVTPHGGICGGESQQWLSYPTTVHAAIGRVCGQCHALNHRYLFRAESDGRRSARACEDRRGRRARGLRAFALVQGLRAAPDSRAPEPRSPGAHFAEDAGSPRRKGSKKHGEPGARSHRTYSTGDA